ncbi:hypothetical protein V6N12_041636, partial [Hibiscus sabdariffa]
MREFRDNHAASKLIGPSPGHIKGGQLTEAVRRQPRAVLLFKEIEKAHPDVLNMICRILKNGILADSEGRILNFNTTLMIMTSNVGSSGHSDGRAEAMVRPGFLNEIDKVIGFRQLTKLEVKEIVDIKIKQVFDRLKAKEIQLGVTERFLRRVVEEGYDSSYGARPLTRAIRLVEDSVTEKMVAREIKEGDSVTVDVDSDGNVDVELSYQFISDCCLPDKAIDLIHEAGVRVCGRCELFFEATRELRSEFMQSKNEPGHSLRMKEVSDWHIPCGEQGREVTEVDIQDIVSSWNGIPVEMVITDESDRLVRMEEILHKRIIGQDEAVKAVSRACLRIRNLNRPIASFIFYGPNGVGKSELAKALAANYFGSEEAVIQLDRSELVGSEVAPRLNGSQPGQLIEVVQRQPYTVVVFDEFIEAYSSVLDMIVQILEHGRLANGKGRIVDFRNTIVILATNGGRPVFEDDDERQMGFDLDQDCLSNRSKSLVMEEIEDEFGPKFANRFDELIVFRQLTELEVKEIADKK